MGPLEIFNGPAVETQPDTLVGWMQTAPDREGWKAAEARNLVSSPDSQRLLQLH